MTEPSNAERIATLESAVAAMPPKKLSRRIILVETLA